MSRYRFFLIFITIKREPIGKTKFNIQNIKKKQHGIEKILIFVSTIILLLLLMPTNYF